MTQDELKLVLDALLHVYHEDEAHPKTLQAITAIKEALAQTERPVDCERCNRLEDALKRANGLAEHFERAWYLRGDEIERLTAQPKQEPVAWRWENAGEDKWLNKYQYLDNGAPDCPEECEPLYTTPPQRPRVVFPTMLRKMWSGSEVQTWLDENVNKEKL